MKEKVVSLAKGNFIYEMPSLVVTPDKLAFEVTAGERRAEVFTLANAKGTRVKGFASVDAVGVQMLSVFNGEENELRLEVDAGELVAGEKLQGAVHLVTDCGEAELPYDIRVVAPVLADEQGPVRDYFALQERLRENPQNGLKLFMDKNFQEAFLYRDEKAKILYEKLRGGNTKLQGMEEFLVAAGAKKPVRFEIRHAASGRADTIHYELSGLDMQDAIRVKLSTGGSVGIHVRSTADFIEPELHVLWTDEFSDNKDILEFRILADKVYAGKRTGRLIFETPCEKREIVITAHNRFGEKERKVARAKKAVFSTLYRNYLAYRERQLPREDYREFLRKNQQIIEKISAEVQLPIAGYIPVMLRDERAILDFYRETESADRPGEGVPLQEVESYIAAKYVKFLYTRKDQERNELITLLEEYLENGYNSVLLFYLRLQADERYHSNHLREKDVREQIEQGVNSPMLYSEMMQIYRREPSLITELDSVTLATVQYGLKNGLVDQQIAEIVSFLAERLPRPEMVAFSVLVELYDRFQLKDTLRSICALLIRGEQRDKKYFVWFERGVAEHLRLTDLFEYYMYTLDYDCVTELPPAVISYFQYENHLNDFCKAYLYARIVEQRKAQPDVFRAYGNQIREFALRQLSLHRISENTGIIYECLFHEENIQGSVAKELPYVMFQQIVDCGDADFDAVLVVHPEMKQEIYYPLEHGKAYVQIYSPDHQLYFVDKDNHYYAKSVDYTVKKLHHLDRFAMACYENGCAYTELLAYLAMEAGKSAVLSPAQVEIMHQVAMMKCFRDYYNGRLLLRLYDYYNEQKETARLLEILDIIEPEAVKRERIGEVAADCIYHGMYDKAEKMLCRYGIQGCDKKALSMLVQEKIHERRDKKHPEIVLEGGAEPEGAPGEFSPILVKWALYLYNEGYYDRGVMTYLLRFYMGRTSILTDIYHKCLEVGGIAIDDGSKERLLGQVLFTGIEPAPYEELFLDYYESGENRVLVKAFLSEIAYEYIVDRLELSEGIFEKIEKEAMYEKDDVMVLAAIKYYSQKEELTARQREFVELGLESYASEGRTISFMKGFDGRVSVPYEIQNSVLIQYYSGTDSNVFLFVKNDEGSFDGEPMRQVFDGIFTKELLLFEGEQKACYIYDEESGEKTSEMLVKRPDNSSEEPGFFQIVNRMIRARNRGDSDEYDRLREKYEEQKGVAGQLFKLL